MNAKEMHNELCTIHTQIHELMDKVKSDSEEWSILYLALQEISLLSMRSYEALRAERERLSSAS